MDSMAGFEHLLKSYDVSDTLDDIASADPPAYLRRCFAEGYSAPRLSWARVQQLALCAIVLDSIVNDRDYDMLEPELIADWRAHYGHGCVHMKDAAAASLRRGLEVAREQNQDAAAELEELERRLASARPAPA
jgi:hypothetical protein